MNKTVIVVLVIVLIAAALGIFLIYRAGNTNNMQGQQSNEFQIQGMKVEILKQGTGPTAKAGDNIVVNYVGTFTDGTKFDSSIDRNEPFPYTLGQNRVIKGWELGLLGMKVGEKRKLTIPYDLAYGEMGRPPIIPPKATLIFEIDMLKIN